MKRIAPGYYRQIRKLGGHEWELEIVKVEGQEYWYWDASCEERGRYNVGGDDWYPRKRDALEALLSAIDDKLFF